MVWGPVKVVKLIRIKVVVVVMVEVIVMDFRMRRHISLLISLRCCLLSVNPLRQHRKTSRRSQVVCMAPDEEKMIVVLLSVFQSVNLPVMLNPTSIDQAGQTKRMEIWSKTHRWCMGSIVVWKCS